MDQKGAHGRGVSERYETEAGLDSLPESVPDGGKSLDVRGECAQAGAPVEETRHIVLLRDAVEQEKTQPTPKDGYLFFYVTPVGVRGVICDYMETDPEGGVIHVFRDKICIVTVAMHTENGGPISWELVHRSLIKLVPLKDQVKDSGLRLLDEPPAPTRGYI